MPKRKGKDRQNRGAHNGRGPAVGGLVLPGEENQELSSADNMSASDCMSETRSVNNDGEEDVDESSVQEIFEDKLKDLIENLTEKSAKLRTDSMKSLIVAFHKKFICDFLDDRKVTIADSLERCLKKGAAEEQAAAAGCMANLLVQLAGSEGAEALFKDMRPLLCTILADTSKSCYARAACAEALAVGSFLASEEITDVIDAMNMLEKIFKASYHKGDGSTRSHTPQVAMMHSSAISGWSMLLSIAPPSKIEELVTSHLDKLPELLTSPDLDVRIAAGETLALMLELAREDENFEEGDLGELCETLKQLATDSTKYRAKKDRRQQRANFRDILRSVEDGENPYYKIKFGVECLHIDSWARKRQYEVFSHILGSGMNVHLQENEFIRDVFGLGSPIPQSAVVGSKETRAERHHLNAAAFKARTKAMAKFRDKRTVSHN